MESSEDQRAYWNRVASTKTFTHPLDVDRLRRALTPSTPILDIGCGYGRLCAEIAALGFEHVTGVDTADAMIRRGRELDPTLDLRTIEPGPLPFRDGSFGAVLLFSVLTCIPHAPTAAELAGEVHRVLRPGGLVFVSDLLLQDDARNRGRYAAAHDHGVPGVFELPEGVRLRHWPRAAVDDLFRAFETVGWTELAVTTMNGNPADAFQLTARRP